MSEYKIGRNSIVGKNVLIGEGTIIGNNVVIESDTIIGNNVRIDDNSVIGKNIMRSANSALEKVKRTNPCQIGSGAIIGSCVVIYRGANIGNEVLVADQASIQFETSVGFRSIVGRGVLIESRCRVGEYVKLESNCYITAYSVIEDYCFIAPGACFSNDNYAGRSKIRFQKFKGVTLKKGARVGVNATVLPGITIYEDGFAAAGSLVTKNIERGMIYAGVPAKKFGLVPEDQLLENQ